MKGFFGNFGTLNGDLTYTVQPGDSLSAISMRYYGDYSHVQAIADANGIDNVNLINVGDTLTIPGVADDTSGQQVPPPAAVPIASPILTPTGSTSPIPYSSPTQWTIMPTTPSFPLTPTPSPSPAPAPTPMPVSPVFLPTTPAPASTIPYASPTYLPSAPPVALPVTPSASASTAPAAPSSFNIWGLLPTQKKILGMTPARIAVVGLGLAGLVMLAKARSKFATNPTRRNGRSGSAARHAAGRRRR